MTGRSQGSRVMTPCPIKRNPDLKKAFTNQWPAVAPPPLHTHTYTLPPLQLAAMGAPVRSLCGVEAGARWWSHHPPGASRCTAPRYPWTPAPGNKINRDQSIAVMIRVQDTFKQQCMLGSNDGVWLRDLLYICVKCLLPRLLFICCYEGSFTFLSSQPRVEVEN